MRCDLRVHLLEQVQRVAQNPEDVHACRSDVAFRRDQLLAYPRHTFAQAGNLLLHVATHGSVVGFAHHQVEIASGGLVHVVDGGQRCGTGRVEPERAQSVDPLDAPHFLGGMVPHVLDVALELLAVAQGLHFTLQGVVEDLAVREAQPVAIRVNALLHGVTVLPHLSPFGTLGRLRPCGKIVWI